MTGEATGDHAGGEGARVVTMPAEAERQYTDHVGMIVFLGSWAMMFGALFFGYVLLRLRAPVWPPPGPTLPLVLPGIATAVMLASEVVLWRTLAALRRHDARHLLAGVLTTIGLGLAFLGLQTVTWVSLWQAGLRLGSGAYASLFYILTLFHALHVLVGIGVLAAMLPASGRHRYDVRHESRLRLSGMFWHFVGIVWVVMFLSMYLA